MGRTHTNGRKPARLAKIQPPRQTGILSRERLYALLDRNRQHPATWIVGPPGAGKTTLVAGYLATRGITYLWNQIDEGDTDPATFFHYLSIAADEAVSGASDRLPRFSPEAVPGLRSFARRFFRQLFVSVPDVALVLDNYQEAAETSLLHEIARTACEEIPAGSHLVIVSRADPPAAYARLHANDTLVMLRWEELQLTADEVEGIARLHGIALTPEGAEAWRLRSGGWAAGLRLLLQETGCDVAAPPESPPGNALFDYFAEEVYLRLPQRTQLVLIATSVVPAVSPALAQVLAADAEAPNELERLAHGGYFTARHGDAPIHYQYHPLFRDFLLRQAAATLSPVALTDLKRHAAILLAREERPEDAAALFAEIGSWPDLRELILGQAMRLIEQGRHLTLESWLRKLPEPMRQADAWSQYWLGACLLLHDPAASLQCFTRAYERFRADGGATDGLLLAWSGAIDAIFHQYDDLAQMDRWLAEFDRRIRPLYDRATPVAKARVSFSMFVALSFRQPERGEIEDWAERVTALERITAQPGVRALIRLHVSIDRLWRGHLTDAVALFESFRRQSDAEAPASPLAPMVECLVGAIIALHLGETARCVEAVKRGLTIARESGLHFWDSTLLWLAACATLNDGDYAAAVRFRAALEANADLLRAADAAYHHALSARLSALHGSHAEALRNAVAAVENIKRLGCPFFTGAWMIGMSCAAERSKDPALAGAFLDEALSIAQRLNNDLLRAVGLLVRAAQAFAADRSEAALKDLRDGMGVCARHGYAGFYFWPRDRIALLCLRALEHDIEPSYATALIRKGSLDPPEEAMASEAWPWPVKVFTLGRFAILRDGEALKFWARRSARR